MPSDECPWCNSRIRTERAFGRGYIPTLEPPHVMWTCDSKQLGDDAKPVQSEKCKLSIQREVEELRGDVQRIKKERDDLLWLLDWEFKERNPVVVKPEWLVFAASLREAAKAEPVEGTTE